MSQVVDEFNLLEAKWEIARLQISTDCDDVGRRYDTPYQDKLDKIILDYARSIKYPLDKYRNIRWQSEVGKPDFEFAPRKFEVRTYVKPELSISLTDVEFTRVNFAVNKDLNRQVSFYRDTQKNGYLGVNQCYIVVGRDSFTSDVVVQGKSVISTPDQIDSFLEIVDLSKHATKWIRDSLIHKSKKLEEEYHSISHKNDPSNRGVGTF